MKNFADRLEGTDLEEDYRAWIICSVIDWCREVGVVTPTERDWCRILGCFPKGKARRGETQKGYLPRSQVRSLLEKLDDTGVIALTKGAGRRRNEVDMPEGKDLIADKRANYEKRKADWHELVKEKLRVEVEVKKTGNWSGVDAFFEYYTQYDANYNMLWENILANNKKKYFSIGSRWNNWRQKFVEDRQKLSQPNTVAKPKVGYRIDEQMNEKSNKDNLLDEWLKMKGYKDYDYLAMHEEFEKYMSSRQKK